MQQRWGGTAATMGSGLVDLDAQVDASLLHGLFVVDNILVCFLELSGKLLFLVGHLVQRGGWGGRASSVGRHLQGKSGAGLQLKQLRLQHL